MKALFLSLLFVTIVASTNAQQNRIDSLRHELSITRNDTLRMIYCDMLGWLFTEIKADSSIYFFKKAIGLAEKFDYKLNEASALNGMAYAIYILGDYPKSLEVLLKASKIAGN